MNMDVKKCTLGSKNQLILGEILSKQVPKEEKTFKNYMELWIALII